jgi:hypothetical protein
MTRVPKTAEDLLQILRPDRAVPELREYFNLAQDPPLYSGARFDSLDGGGAREDVKNTVTPADILAVQCLSVVVPAPTALTLIEGQLGRQVANCLQDIPTDLDLGDPDALDHLRPGSRAEEAWHLLKQQDDVGWVIAGKILARKRPRLIPIWDNVVKCANGRPPNAWLWIGELLAQDTRLTDLLDDLPQQAGLLDVVSRIRVLDVAIWMRHRHDHRPARCPGMRLTD